MLAALRSTGMDKVYGGSTSDAAEFVEISAEAAGRSGSRFRRVATVELMPGDRSANGWRILEWEQPGR